MSTFTGILQQKINNLEAQICQLQEQNYNLRRKARWLMEATPDSPSQSPQSPESPGLGYSDVNDLPPHRPLESPPKGKDPGLLYVPSGPWEKDPLFVWSQYQSIFNNIELYFWWLNQRYAFANQNGYYPPVGWPPIGLPGE